MSRPLTIIGGGLAGLTLGIGLRKQNIPVAIYESGDYPRHRVCGEFISGRGQAALERMGLVVGFEKAGAVYARSVLFVSGGIKSPVRQLATPALCLSRYEMEALLAEKFRELGGDLRARSRWNGNRDNEGMVFATGRRLEPSENEIRWFGVKGHVVRSNAVRLEADLEMHISPNGYVGINRVNDGRINVCGLFRARPGKWRPDSKAEWLLGQPKSLLRKRLENAQFDTASFCSIAGLQLKPRLAAIRDECCVGDALTMTPPVTGNGMSMAFESAEMALEPLASYSRGEISWDQARTRIAARFKTAFSRRLAWARVLQWIIVARTVQSGFGPFLLRSSWLWQFMFARTR